MPQVNLSPNGTGQAGNYVGLLVGNQHIATMQGHTVDGYPIHFTNLDIRPNDLKDLQVEILEEDASGIRIRYRNYPDPIEDFDEEANRITGVEVLDAFGNITLIWTE